MRALLMTPKITGGGGRQPDASRTLLYLKLNSNLTDDSGNSNSVSGSGISYGTIGNNHYAELTSTSGYIRPPQTLGQAIENGDYTVSFFCNTVSHTNQGDSAWWFGNRYDSGSPRPGIYIRCPSGNTVFITADGSYNPIVYTSSLTVNTWYYITMTRISGVVSIYLNGTYAGGYTDTFNMKTPRGVNKFYILNRSDYSPQRWTATGAKISEVIFEKVGWTSQEIIDYLNSQKANYGIS